MLKIEQTTDRGTLTKGKLAKEKGKSLYKYQMIFKSTLKMYAILLASSCVRFKKGIQVSSENTIVLLHNHNPTCCMMRAGSV